MSQSILVIAEHDNSELKSATLNTLSAALQIKALTDHSITLLIAGHNCTSVAQQAATAEGVDHVICADNRILANQLAEEVAPIIINLHSAGTPFSHILSASSTTGKNLLPRVAALLDVSQLSEIIQVVSADSFVRPTYAGNILATVKSSDTVKVMSVRTSAFELADGQSGSASVIEHSDVTSANLSRFISNDSIASDRVELTSARTVISGGRGMQSGDNFPMLERVADKIGAAVGASRAAVDSGFVSNDLQVGQTGKIVAPDLYIAVGISGAIQHLAGMKDSKVIVAINKDEEAPIFSVADYGLVADLFEAIPELEQQL
jgi:electron transfer flavoprotein alpha subunit